MAAKFSKNDFEAICECCRSGNRSTLESYLELHTANRDDRNNLEYSLCPDPSLHISSPLVLASQYGHLSIVVLLIDKYSSSVDINTGATIISHTTKKKVHHATPLWAASTGGHLEIVKYLISKGANVNKTTLTHSTPLRGASFHGYIEIMECLLNNGADLNSPNCIGQSPLCIAAMRGKGEAVEFLLGRGADRNQCTINGYTVMHLAAAKGKSDVMRLLMSHGVSPMFQPADPTQQGYVPCPLFLAASTGQHKAVDVLIEREDCPLECKADAYLLLAAMQCELRKRVRVMEPKIQEYWERGLRIREENELPITATPLLEAYQYQTEITSCQELSTVWHSPGFSHLGVFYQSLLIRERCMGYLDQGLIYFLIRRGSYFCHDGRCREAELLWKRAMDMEVMVCQVEIDHASYGHCEGILRDLEKDLGMFLHGVHQMLRQGYEPDFQMYLDYGLKEIQLLSSLDHKADAEIVNNEIIIGMVLELFLTWIVQYTSLNSSTECATPTKSPDTSANAHATPTSDIDSAVKHIWPPECDKLGREFVSKYLHFRKGTTLLHLAVTNFSIGVDSDKCIFDIFADLCPLVNALLVWGAESVIDEPDGRGLRPVHIAVQLEDEEGGGDKEVLTPLIEGGAHIDAVDSKGQTVYDLCVTPASQAVLNSIGPPSLLCTSARTVIANKINYHSLPRRVRDFIYFHDSRCM